MKPLANRTVVVVDDRAPMLELLEDGLAHAGAHVLRAYNGLDALARVIETERVDALVSDLRMPGMTGLDLVRAVRELADSSKSGIVAVAVSGDESWKYFDPNKAVAAGFDYHLTKPIEVPTLVHHLRELIERRERKSSGTLARIDAEVVASRPRSARPRSMTPRTRRR